eukprot:scaffold3037_cov230-Pinguiococcus_pyrenoidosus.AAC.2
MRDHLTLSLWVPNEQVGAPFRVGCDATDTRKSTLSACSKGRDDHRQERRHGNPHPAGFWNADHDPTAGMSHVGCLCPASVRWLLQTSKDPCFASPASVQAFGLGSHRCARVGRGGLCRVPDAEGSGG